LVAVQSIAIAQGSTTTRRIARSNLVVCSTGSSTGFETAKAPGRTISQSLLLCADEVIQ
jgi:hypothetical protein